MVKAASISYAIFMAALTALFCYGLVLVFSLNTNLEDHYAGRSSLLAEQYSAQAFAKANFYSLPVDEWLVVNGTADGIQQGFKRSTWGMLDELGIQTLGFNDSIVEHYLLAPQMETKAPTLYLKDQDDPLKLSGTTKITGTIACAKGQINRVRINSSTRMQIEQTGTVLASQSRLPSFKAREFVLPATTNENYLDPELSEHHRDFNASVGIYTASSYLSAVSLSGKIVVQSADTLYIAADAKLKDVIVKAPKIVVAANFKGSVQLIATDEIVLESDVQLQFPSVLMITDNTTGAGRISIGEKALVQGAVYLPESKIGAEAQSELIINDNAEVLGHVYCGGILEIYGDVQGRVIAGQLLYKTQTTKHSNLLKDVQLLEPEQPSRLFALNESAETNPLILKKL